MVIKVEIQKMNTVIVFFTLHLFSIPLARNTCVFKKLCGRYVDHVTLQSPTIGEPLHYTEDDVMEGLSVSGVPCSDDILSKSEHFC